jgi:hypothetical protein
LQVAQMARNLATEKNRAPAVEAELEGLRRQVYSDQKVANRNVRDFGWKIAQGIVTRRPPISFDTMVPCAGGYAYDVGAWDSSII